MGPNWRSLNLCLVICQKNSYMTIRNKIFSLFAFSVIVLAIVLFLFRNTQEHQNDIILQSAAEQQAVLVNTAINVQSDQLDQIVNDYTNWDDIILNIKNPVFIYDYMV